MNPGLSLLVLRSARLEATLAFYRALGLTFVQEQHGGGPVHFSAQMGDLVMEIYPGTEGASLDRKAGGATMLGFRIASVDGTLAAVQSIGAVVITAAAQSPWGRRAVVADPDGRAVELSEPLESAQPA